MRKRLYLWLGAAVAAAIITLVGATLLTGPNGGRLYASPGGLVPAVLNYQGRLTNAAGQPLTDGSYTIEFRLYGVPTGGTSAWNETQTVALSGGLFNVLLGSVTPLTVANIINPLYLEVVVQGEVMTPRQQMVSVPFALRADDASRADYASDADMLDGKDSTEFAPASHTHAGGSGDITAVNVGTGLTGGGTTGDVTLSLATNYADGSAYDSRFVNATGDTMAGNLTVNGTVSATKVTYPSARTHYYSVPPEAFSPQYNVDYTNAGGGAYLSGGVTSLMNAAVNLPDGAIVTQFKAFFYDDSATVSLGFLLMRLTLNGSGILMAAVESPLAAVVGYYGSETATLPAQFATVDNSQYGYVVNAGVNGWDGSKLRIKGVVITYTINEAP